MSEASWPEYIVDNKGQPYRLLCKGERIKHKDVIVDPRSETPSYWQTTFSARVGDIIGKDTISENIIYYRKLTNPLTIAMAQALAAQQPEDKAG